MRAVACLTVSCRSLRCPLLKCAPGDRAVVRATDTLAYTLADAPERWSSAPRRALIGDHVGWTQPSRRSRKPRSPHLSDADLGSDYRRTEREARVHLADLLAAGHREEAAARGGAVRESLRGRARGRASVDQPFSVRTSPLVACLGCAPPNISTGPTLSSSAPDEPETDLDHVPRRPRLDG
jgi:hypothetical protein